MQNNCGTNRPSAGLINASAVGAELEVQMTTACNWENRVRREVRPILNDGAWVGDEVRSTPNGRVLPITGHVMHEHEYIARYERATYIWDTNGTGHRTPRKD